MYDSSVSVEKYLCTHMTGNKTDSLNKSEFSYPEQQVPCLIEGCFSLAYLIWNNCLDLTVL